MIRLLLLTISCTIVFIGFAMAFVIEGVLGISLAMLLVSFGSILVWIFEFKSKKSLEKESTLNRILKADGEDFIERK